MISFEKKGIIRLNKFATDALLIKVNDRINILQDEDNPRDWYIEKTTEEEGLVMRKHNTGSVCCNSISIVSAFRKSHGFTGTISLRIATQMAFDDSGMHAILVSSAK
jgi:hypothetical protein